MRWESPELSGLLLLALPLLVGGSRPEPFPADWVHAYALPGTRPSATPGDYERCVKLDARGRKREPMQTTDAQVQLRCEPLDRKHDRVCLRIPEQAEWPRMPFESSCTLGKREHRLAFYDGHPAALQPGDELYMRMLHYDRGVEGLHISMGRSVCVPLWEADWRAGALECDDEQGFMEELFTGQVRLAERGWEVCLVPWVSLDTVETIRGACALPTVQGEVSLPIRIERQLPTWD